MSSSNSCDRNSERRAAYIIQINAVAESDALRVTAMFTANSDRHSGIYGATFFDSHFHELAGAVPVEYCERILLEDSLVDILEEELVFSVVA